MPEHNGLSPDKQSPAAGDPTREMQEIKESDEAKVRSFLTEKGYVVIDLRPNWRHFVAKLRDRSSVAEQNADAISDEPLLHFKMTRLPEAASRTKTEIAWLEAMQPLQTAGQLPFLVGQLREQGELNGLPYFIGTNWTGPTLVNQRAFEETGEYDTTLLERYLPEVINIALYTTRTKDWPALPLDHQWDNPKVYVDLAENVFQRLEEKHGPQPQLSPLLEIVQTIPDRWETSAKFGDLDPWHLFEVKGQNDQSKLAIIDAEAAAAIAPKFHDLAYLAARICERGGKIELATRLIEQFTEQLDANELQSFKRLGLALLALRCLTSYYDRWDNRHFHDQLRGEILSGRLVK